ncbi:MAG: hypothetical protein JWM57_2664 [Phycisphaerales bacterium]|nr:hypothetical protein [Phycisphaerales bacterium]
MNRRRLLSKLAASSVAVALIGAGLASSFSLAYPEPSVSPISWELKFVPAAPKRIVVEVPGQPTAKAYWYVTYSVTNNSGQDVNFLPTFEWVTNEGKVVRSDKNISNVVFDKVKAAAGLKFLENSVKIAGLLRQGEDQAKDGVAIWEEPEGRLGTFSIFVTGLSGESTQLPGADGKPIVTDGKPILLYKTLELDYKLAGDEVYPGNDLLTKLGQKWVMR